MQDVWFKYQPEGASQQRCSFILEHRPVVQCNRFLVLVTGELILQGLSFRVNGGEKVGVGE